MLLMSIYDMTVIIIFVSFALFIFISADVKDSNWVCHETLC